MKEHRIMSDGTVPEWLANVDNKREKYIILRCDHSARIYSLDSKFPIFKDCGSRNSAGDVRPTVGIKVRAIRSIKRIPNIPTKYS